MKKLPLGIQKIRAMIETTTVYVDKTGFAFDLIEDGKHYFISRPRRFGKSLFLNTLEEIFKRNRTLFKGLAIDQTDYDWQEYPVLTFNFAQIASHTPIEFEDAFKRTLQKMALSLLDLATEVFTVEEGLETLIVNLSKKNRVVVLVDEYDSPIINTLKNLEFAEQNRDLLRAFLTALKSLDSCIEFTFVTGVSRFSEASIFSGPNHLTNITMDPEYAAMLGYTEEEVRSNFKDPIQAIAQKRNQSEDDVIQEMRTWYSGYRFSEEETSVYNPFSVLNFMKNQTLKPYWYPSGAPSLLIDTLKKDSNMVSLDGTTANQQTLIDISRLAKIGVAPLMYQMGYLTIKEYHPVSNLYDLGLPNEEVRTTFFHSLLEHFTSIKTLRSSEESIKALERQEPGFLFEQMRTGFARFPYQVFADAQALTYQGMLLAMLYRMGFAPLSERPTHTGQIDVGLNISNTIYIMQLNLNRSAAAALKQMYDKKYFQLYLNKEKEIVMIGAHFSSQNRNISDWKGEVLSPSGQKIKDLFP